MQARISEVLGYVWRPEIRNCRKSAPDLCSLFHAFEASQSQFNVLNSRANHKIRMTTQLLVHQILQERWVERLNEVVVADGDNSKRMERAEYSSDLSTFKVQQSI